MSINIKETYLARPINPTRHSPIILSNLDLIMSPIYSTYIYFFKNINNDKKFMDVHKIFASLEDILSDYYPLAGRLKKEPEGRMSIVPSDKGVPFVVAESLDTTIKQFEEKNWEIGSILNPFIPVNIMADSIDVPLLAVQHTTLADGSVALGIATHHLTTDGNGYFTFVDNWGRKARKEPFIPPIHDRSLLKASGNPPTQEHNEFLVINFPINFNIINNKLVKKYFHFSKSNLKKLHDTYSSKDPNDSLISTNDALVAHIWRTVTRARGVPLNEQVNCGLPIDVRRILRPPIPRSYFGNAVLNMHPKMLVSDLINGPRSRVALHIREALTGFDDSRIRSAIDWIEEQPNKYEVRPGGFSVNGLIVSSLNKFPVCDLDFGYGTSVKNRLRGDGLFDGTVIILKIDDGSEVCITLLDEHMQKLEQDPEFRMFLSLLKL